MQVMPMQTRAGGWKPETADADKRTVELVWSTGAKVERWRYVEELSMDPAHVRLTRLNNGANLLDSHNSYALRSVIGVVEKAEIRDGEGLAVVRFSERDDVQPIWRDVQAGILRNISVGYLVHRYEKHRAKNDGELDIWRAVDWEPVEISLVSVPADPGAAVRALPAGSQCEICDAEALVVLPAAPRRNARALALMERNLRRRAA